MDPRVADGFLGTGARLMADVTLLLYFPVIIAAMLLGYYFARRKLFRPHHKLTMTAVTLINWALILYHMLNTYRGLANTGEIPMLVTIHLLTGALAQLMATYLVILMWTENTPLEFVLPKALRINNIKAPMRATLTLWIVTALLGIGIYLSFNTAGEAAAGESPLGTPEVTPETRVESMTATEEADEDDDEPVETEEADDDGIVETEEADDDDGIIETEEADDDDGIIETEEADDDDNSGSGSNNSGSGNRDDDDEKPAETQEASAGY
jgi:uncharacterized membrane protein YozB (DUF420 family)